MTDKVKYTSLTPITSDAQLRRAVNDIIANLAPLTGQHRERGNQAVTWLDLINAGYQYDFDGDGNFVLPPVTGPEEPDTSTPPAVDAFTAVASFNYVTMSWGQPRYKNHSHVEIWRADGYKTVGQGPNVPTVLGDAVFRIMSPSVVASDTVLPGDVWRYWARNVSSSGVVGPWTSVDGLLVAVPESPAYLIDKISGEIRESDLYIDLGAKIDGSDKGMKSLQQLTESSYTVKIDSGNAVSGFGLMVDGATGRSDFIIRADRFAIAAPQAYDQNGKPVVNTNAFPFVVDVTNPAVPKTLIKNAYIDQAFIQTLVTGSLVADRITGQTLTGTHIRGGDMVIGANFNVDGAGSATMLNAFIKGTMQSNNYAAGSAGWQVRNDGYAEFRQAVVRGTIYADAGYFNGTVYAERMVGGAYTKRNYGGNYHADNADTNWRTALRVTVARGMAVVRKLELSGTAGHFDMTCVVEGSGSGTLTRTLYAEYEVRIVRDWVVVEASSVLGFDLSATSNPSSGPVTTRRSGGLGIGLIANVPADSATHVYDLQFRFVRIGGDAGSGSSATAGCNSSDGSTAVMYIENGDLA